MTKKFAIVGVAGYVAPRHLRAIRDTGNTLVTAFDPFDSVGVIDSYFPDAEFFTEFEDFDRHLETMIVNKHPLDYMSICSPNHLHDAHMMLSLRHNSNAICEKPMVLDPSNLDTLEKVEQETGKRVYTILQLRLHETIKNLKKKIDEGPNDKIYDIDLTYITSRGHWYHNSWKGDLKKSGGIATNIGIHFFDMLMWIFGDCEKAVVHEHNEDHAAGFMQLKKANVRWFLSINSDHLPAIAKEEGKRTYRSITIEGEELEFSKGFTDLHTLSYQDILDGNGFGIQDNKPSLELVYKIRNMKPEREVGERHPMIG